MYRSNVLELLRVLGTHNFGTWSHCSWVSKIGTKFCKDLVQNISWGAYLGPPDSPRLDVHVLKYTLYLWAILWPY